MRADTQAAYDRLGDWERVIASHFSGENFQEGPKENWDRVPGYASNQNPSVWEYVHGVEKYISDADPSMFGGAAPAALPTAPEPMPTIADPQAAAQHFVDAALAQRGDKYVFGAEADMNDANPTSFDRSELTQWAAHQAGIEIPDGSAAQYLDLKAKGLLIPVDQAAHTPGRLAVHLFQRTDGRRRTPDHLARGDQPGQRSTVEADDVQGVTTMDIGSRFQYAAVLPGLQGVTAVPPPPFRCRPRPHVPVTTPASAAIDPTAVLPGTRSTQASTSAIPTPTATMTA